MHIAFVMDGNRTWAKVRGFPTFEGHRRGYDNVETIIRACNTRGMKYASFWALSDDNIKKRSTKEITYLFDLLVKGIGKLIKECHKNNARAYFIGDRTLIRHDCVAALERGEKETAMNTGIKIIFAVGYGGQEEILRAIQILARQGRDLADVSKEDLLEVLDTGKFPPPDLIVRTGNHMRHSGFFLFQSPYAEYFFSQKNWPDFSEEELDTVLVHFENQTRKFGK